MLKKFGVILVTMVAISSCYYDKEEQLYPSSFINVPDTATYYYAKDIQPIISGSCAISGCHVAGTGRVDLSTYTGVKNNVAAVNNRAVVIKDMPASGPLSPADINKLKNWIEAGALNN
jgi:hypothetical protein